MKDLVGEALRRAERIAGDYHLDNEHAAAVDELHLAEAAARLRAYAESLPTADGFGDRACAQLLEEISRARRRGEHVGTGILHAAARVADRVVATEWPAAEQRPPKARP